MDGRIQGVIHLAVLLGAAHEGREISGIGAAQGVVQTDQAAAPFDERLERDFLAVTQIGCVAFVNHDDVGMFQVGAGGGM